MLLFTIPFGGANVLSDVSGMTGQAIVRAILAGERDPYQLAALRNWLVKASEEEITRSLEGNWQEDLLFVQQQEQDVRVLPEADGRLRSAATAVSPAARRPKPWSQLPEEKRKERLRKKKRGMHNRRVVELRAAGVSSHSPCRR